MQVALYPREFTLAQTYRGGFYICTELSIIAKQYSGRVWIMKEERSIGGCRQVNLPESLFQPLPHQAGIITLISVN